jgi:hypothetical protein
MLEEGEAPSEPGLPAATCQMTLPPIEFSILGLHNKAKRKGQLISVPIVVEKGCYHLPRHASSIRSVKLESLSDRSLF